jgi:hypothetical protein
MLPHLVHTGHRKLLTRAIQLFGKLSITTLQELYGPTQNGTANNGTSEPTPSTAVATHPAYPARTTTSFPKEPGNPIEEVKILVESMLRKTTANMGNMRGQVLRLLEQGDKRNYQEWLTRQQIGE